MLLYTEGNPNGEKYRNLHRSGLIIQVCLGDTNEDIWLEGVRVSTLISELYQMIWQKTSIHPSSQRLFLGGEELRSDASLLDYYCTSSEQEKSDCVFRLRSFIPLLISTLDCPGPMLSEVEVSPKHDEPIYDIKRRIRDKFRIEIDRQRLHLHPSTMVSFVRRRPLDDIRLLSTYLPFSVEKKFLEVIVQKSDPENLKSLKKIYIRLPRKVTNTRAINNEGKLSFSSTLHCNMPLDTKPSKTFNQKKENTPAHPDQLPPPPPPQTPESDLAREETPNQLSPSAAIDTSIMSSHVDEVWWLTIPVSIDQIIRRDPTVKDIEKVLNEVFKSNTALANQFTGEAANRKPEELFETKTIGFKLCSTKPVTGDKRLDPIDTIYSKLLMRHEEMLLCLTYRNMEDRLEILPAISNADDGNTVINSGKNITPLIPLLPLKSYTEKNVCYTAPPDPVSLRWSVDPTHAIDCGAKPGATFELTGASYSIAYGSWDIPEHRKTYAEISVEGSLHVGDLGLCSLIRYDPCSGEERHDFDAEVLIGQSKTKQEHANVKQRKQIVFYVQDAVEVTLLAPVNSLTVRSKTNKLFPPFSTESANKWANQRKQLISSQQDLRKGSFNHPTLPKPAPFHLRVDERCIDKSQLLSDILPSWKDRRQINETEMGKWYLGREKVTDIAVKPIAENGGKMIAFATLCDRGVSTDGRPYLAVTYKRLIPVFSDASMIYPRNAAIDSLRKDLDFRIQAQFYICNPIDEELCTETANFTVRLRQRIIRVHHETHTPDEVTNFETPHAGLEAAFNVKLATPEWHRGMGFQLSPTIELQSP